MQRYVKLTEERFEELMNAAYLDGFEDACIQAFSEIAAIRDDLDRGARATECAEEDWPSSVTKDTVDAEIKKARNA